MASKYPRWKLAVWRYVRVFIAAFVSYFGVNLVMFNEPELLKSVVVSAIAAGLAAITKLLRENEPYDAPIHKLPI